MSDLVSIEMRREDAADLLVALDALALADEVWGTFPPLVAGTVALRDGLRVEDMIEATAREVASWDEE